MPFPDSAFDAAWSIWTLEHVPNPEMALNEMRRVVKSNGYVLLQPAWNTDPWLPRGLRKRPYGELGWRDRLTKFSIPLRELHWYRAFYLRQVRVIRSLVYHIGRAPVRLRFTSTTPSYEESSWESDADSTSSLDRHETLLWFTSRGDRCLNCSESALLLRRGNACPAGLVIQVHK